MSHCWDDHDMCICAVIRSIAVDTSATRADVETLTQKIRQLKKEIRIMGAKQDVAYAQLVDDLNKVVTGWASLIAERDALKAALEQADASKAAAVTAALDEDDTHDADAIIAADAIVSGLVDNPPPAPEPAPEG
jgi:hypothetical protein